MFTLVRRFIKTGIAFLMAGLAVGLYLLIRRELYGIYPTAHIRSAHMHAVLVGFMMFLILGVALWLFPRAPKEDTRYRPERIAASYWILLTATSSRFVAELVRDAVQHRVLAWIIIAGGLGQVLGLALYFWTMWPRIRPVGSQLREAAGEKF
jgi:hypothetical protein